MEKVVVFDLWHAPDVFNLCLSDYSEVGEIEDMTNTNNGDLIKVMATVITIIVDFLNSNPQATVTFSGSSENRMNLYSRIIKRYHLQYSAKYYIGGLIWKGDQIAGEVFNPEFQEHYKLYFIKRKLAL